MIEYEEAQKIIIDSVQAVGQEEVSLEEAPGRVLAEDAAADADIPVCDNSTMDGFAVRREDVKNAKPGCPVRLEVVETIAAGHLPEKQVGRGRASRIMTGAVIPTGADAVVMFEDTENDGETHVLIRKPVGNRSNIRKAGEDVKKGSIVLSAGRLLKPADIGILAASGHPSVHVSRRPVIGIISTGDEIIAPDQPLVKGRVRNSNSFALYTKCIAAGTVPRRLGIVRDSREDLEKVLSDAAAECDIVLTTGGVSMGKFDRVRDTVETLGNIIFRGVRIKPGKPLVFGEICGTPIFGLPGNPAAAMVDYELFVRPALMKMVGAKQIFRPLYIGVLDHDLKIRKSGFVHALHATATIKKDGYHLSTAYKKSPGMLSGMVIANCLAIADDMPKQLRRGDLLEFFFVD